MHYQVPLGDFSQYFDGFDKGFIVHSQMLHGIQVEAHSNPAVVHYGDQISDEFFCLEVKPAGCHSLFVKRPIRI